MGAYLWLFVLLAYLGMTIIFVAALVLYMLSLPVTLRVHVPSDDSGHGAEAGEGAEPKGKESSLVVAYTNPTRRRGHPRWRSG